MSRPDLFGLAVRERGALLDLLDELTPAQWGSRSLCSEWTVRDVAVHVVSYDELAPLALAGTFLRGGLRIAAVNDVALRRYAGLAPEGVLALVGRCQQPRGLTAALRGGIALCDGTIHQQDIRRALGLPRRIPDDQLLAVLRFAMTAPTLPARRVVRGLRLVATDVDWSHGTGPEVSGAGEALLMAVVGRPDALPELRGAGVATLESRLGARMTG